MYGIILKQNSLGIRTIAVLFSKPVSNCERVSFQIPMVLEYLFCISAGSHTLLCLDIFFLCPFKSWRRQFHFAYTYLTVSLFDVNCTLVVSRTVLFFKMMW